VIRSCRVSDKEFSIQAKCWHLIANAFFRFGLRGFDCFAQFLERHTLIRTHCREIFIVRFNFS